jgi:hypothetical protein
MATELSQSPSRAGLCTSKNTLANPVELRPLAVSAKWLDTLATGCWVLVLLVLGGELAGRGLWAVLRVACCVLRGRAMRPRASSAPAGPTPIAHGHNNRVVINNK